MKDLIEILKDPRIYPHKPASVQCLQTHISWIFLTGGYVYKIKKPLNLGFLDYTTLKKRKYFCFKELKLNRRLSPQIYLDVVKITKEGDRIVLEGAGRAIEYALKMREMPQDRMMDRLIKKDLVDEGMMTRIAEKIATFHRHALRGGKVSPFGSIFAIRSNTDENFEQTKSFIGKTITPRQYEEIVDYTNRFFEENSLLFDQRISEGRIRDCHGDLHSRNICLADDIYIYDCIEFNDRFRYSDVASEVAFLAMDLDFHYKFRLSDHFIKSYIELSGDEGLPLLLNFYKCYRAYVRGKVEGFLAMAEDSEKEVRDKAFENAKSYFKLAHSYTRKRPLLLVMCGLVGTGKSHLAQYLSRELYLEVVSSDVVRKHLAGIPKGEHRYERFEEGIYSRDFTRKTYEALYEEAKGLLGINRGVILDASFVKREDRMRVSQLAKEYGADFLLIECRCPDEVTRERLILRSKEEGVISNGRLEIYEAQRENFEEVNEIPSENHLIIDTSKPVTADLIYGFLKGLN